MRKHSLQVPSHVAIDQSRRMTSIGTKVSEPLQPYSIKKILSRGSCRPGTVDFETCKQHNHERLQQIHEESQQLMEMVRQAKRMQRHKQPQQAIRTQESKELIYDSPIRINKQKVLRRLEQQYMKVDPAFRIVHYISENEALVERHRYKQFLKPAPATLAQAHITQLQRQIKTPLKIASRERKFKNRQLDSSLQTQQTFLDDTQSPGMVDRQTLFQERWRQMRRLKLSDTEAPQQETIQITCQALPTNEDSEVKELPSPEQRVRVRMRHPQEHDNTVSDFSLEQEQMADFVNVRNHTKKKRSPLMFLFWKFKSLVHQVYDTSSVPMKNLIDFYSPARLDENSKPMPQATSLAKKRKKRANEQIRGGSVQPRQSYVDQSFYKHKPQTPYQKSLVDRMNNSMLESLVQVEESVRRQIRVVDRRKHRNDYSNLIERWDELLSTHKKELKEQIDVSSYMNDRPFLKELVQLMKKESPEEDFSIFDVLLVDDDEISPKEMSRKLKDLEVNQIMSL